MKRLILTVGLPRSGKTTWARTQTGVPIVSPDAIRYALHGQRYVQLAEPFVWATAKVMVRALFGAGHDVVIVDATNATRARRDEWRDETNWRLGFKLIPASAAECLGRAAAEGDLYIMPVIEYMAAKFEPVTEAEEPWEFIES